jgi:hypothetical protein
MISVDSLLYKIDLKLNKLSTNEHQSIPVENKILVLNEAQLKLIKQKVDGISVVSGLGFDAFKKRYEDLQALVENYIDHPLIPVEIDSNLNQWVVNIHSLSPTYMFYVDSYLLADKGECKNRIVWINQDLSKHGDTSILLKNDHYKPSFEYQETFNIISSDEMSVFTDGTFTPTKVYIMYLRYPQYIDKVGYVKFDGSLSIDNDCELEAYLEDELLDLTVQALAMYTENAPAVQSSQFRIQTNE